MSAHVLFKNHLLCAAPIAVLALDPQNKKARFRLGTCTMIVSTLTAQRYYIKYILLEYIK